MFGHYRLDGVLGAGGMGEVHRAWDTEQERVVALKVLPDSLSRDDEYRGRFRREARLASRLNDPHVVPIHRHGEIDGQLYLEMRLIDGDDLGSVLSSGTLAPAEAAQLTTDVASALDAAHEAGLVHRDVKPSNVFLTRPRPGAPRFAYLGDFGIARTMVSSSDAVRTASGTTMGTLAYMAPERFLGREADGRVDVYALACVLYECIVGQAPFPGNELATVMHHHLEVDPPLPSAHDPSLRAFDDVVTRGMAKDPADRFATAGELAVAARAAAAGGSPVPSVTAVAPPGHDGPPSIDSSGPSRPAGSRPGSGPVRPAGGLPGTGPAPPGGGYSGTGPARPGDGFPGRRDARPGGGFPGTGPTRSVGGPGTGSAAPGGGFPGTGPAPPGGGFPGTGPAPPGGRFPGSGPGGFPGVARPAASVSGPPGAAVRGPVVAPWTPAPAGPRPMSFPTPRAPLPSSIEIPRLPATPLPVVPDPDGARQADRTGLLTVGVGVLLWLVAWFGLGTHTGTAALAVPVVAAAAGLVLGAVRWGMARTGPSAVEAAATALSTAFLVQILLTARLDGPPVAYVAVMSVLAALVPVGVAVTVVASGTRRGPDVGDGLVCAAFAIAVAVWFWRTAETSFPALPLRTGLVLLVVGVAATVAAVRATALPRRRLVGAGITLVAVEITLGTAGLWRDAGPLVVAVNVLLAVGLMVHLVALGTAFVRWARRPGS